MIKWFRKRNKSPQNRSGEEWVKGLSHPADNAVVADLRDLLIRGLKPALSKYVDREQDAFAEDMAQNALLKILDKLDTFRGESKFTTWALKIAVREGLTELRLKRYEDISLDSVLARQNTGVEGHEIIRQFEGNAADPGQITHERMVLQKILKIIEQDLSDKQKRAVQCLVVEGLSITVTAELMQTNRNALYKLMHDARLKIKQVLLEEGIEADSLSRLL